MKTITTNELDTVCGGASKNNSDVTALVTSLQSSIKDLANNNNNKGSTDSLMPVMMMMAMNRPAPQQTVVAAGAPAPVAAGPIVNISNRFRRW